MPDNFSGETQHWLRGFGFDVRPDPTVKYATGFVPGRPDMVLVKNGRAVYGENKWGENGWNTVKWTAEQRKYSEWLESQNGSEVYIFLHCGRDAPNRNRTHFEPRTLFVIPFHMALLAVDTVEKIQSTIPFRAKRRSGMNPKLSELGLDCERLFGRYALIWCGSGIWRFPPGHIFAVNHLYHKPISEVFAEREVYTNAS